MHLLIHISKFHFQKVHSSPVIYTFLVVCERVHLPTHTIMRSCHSFFFLASLMGNEILFISATVKRVVCAVFV